MNLIPIAHAATQGASHTGGSLLSMLPIFVIFVAVFYFLIIRPQSKRAKQHQKLINELTIGDEVMTAGGIIGKVAKLRDPYIVITIAEGVDIKLQKSSIAQILPKLGNQQDNSEENA